MAVAAGETAAVGEAKGGETAAREMAVLGEAHGQKAAVVRERASVSVEPPRRRRRTPMTRVTRRGEEARGRGEAVSSVTLGVATAWSQPPGGVELPPRGGSGAARPSDFLAPTRQGGR